MTRWLVVIDVQEAYFADGPLHLSQAEETETRIARSIGQARAAGDKVILVRHISPNTNSPFADGGPGIAIRPAILAAAGDAIMVTKHNADAFQDTDLADHLAGVRQVLICGMMTQNCVVFTTLTSLTQGRDTQVIGDLCAAPSDLVHGVALNSLREKTTVTTAEKVWGAAIGTDAA